MTDTARRPVTVRMYNVGFGDCFLLTFPAADRDRKVLVDCGFHQAGPPPVPLAQIVGQVLADVAEDGAPRIDVVVCTHRHRDHVLGFESGVWSGVAVDEVWMPWTEDPDDPEATRIRNSQARKALAVLQALAASGANDANAARARSVAENSLTNAAAMATLHHGFAGRPKRRFLPARAGGETARQLDGHPLPGVAVHVLGPARDRDTIRDMDPPVDESYLRFAGAGAAGPAVGVEPRWSISPRGDGFGRWFAATTEAAAALPEQPGPLRPSDPDFAARWLRSLDFSWHDVRQVDRFAALDPLAAAVAIEQAVNGTSLVLAFELGGAVLLFPGDAQWGTWERATADPIWRDLLGRTTFLKVGHHGSHNATPRRFLDADLPAGLLAMVPTRTTTRFKDIPRGPLLARLQARAQAVVRSDDVEVIAPFTRVSPICVEATVPV